MQPEVKEEKVPDQAPVAQEQTEQKEEAPKSSKDWERFREARAAERKQAEEIAKQAQKSAQEAAALRAALESVVSKPVHQNEYEQPDETDEQRIEKKVQEIIAKREEEYAKKRQEEEIKNLPKILSQAHQDFQQVCSQENLDYFEYHFPEVAHGFRFMPEGFEKWSSLYKAMKKLMPNASISENMKKAENNLKKPQSIPSPTVSAPGQSLPSVIDEARKRANWERMQKTLKGID